MLTSSQRWKLSFAAEDYVKTAACRSCIEMQRRQESEVTRTGSETTYKPERKFSLDVFTFMEMPALAVPLHASTCINF